MTVEYVQLLDHSVGKMNNAVLQRYMPSSRLYSMLESSKLFFGRADEMARTGDPLEGARSAVDKTVLHAGLPNLSDAAITTFEEYMVKPSGNPLHHFLSCWYCAADESPDMWKVYGAAGTGIAVRGQVPEVL